MTLDFGQQLIDFLPNLHRFALSLCRSGDIANDLVQETCEKALKSQHGFEAGTRLDAWLFKILRNCWIDRLRRTKTRGTTIDITEAPDIVGTDGTRTMESRLMLNATAMAMDRLPDDYREVLLLVCVEELSYAQTALVLDVPVGTVMSRLARARVKISQLMGIETVSARSSDKSGSQP
ncbi:MAG: RNA polymerase sigma factor [Alphaproteobacteria bacterium]|nr:RNA polymerase sigma factor [Alphaproteobacteria bacterium]